MKQLKKIDLKPSLRIENEFGEEERTSESYSSCDDEGTDRSYSATN